MKLIPLFGGKFAKVDDDDYDKLVGMGSWHLSGGYASRYSPGNIKIRKRLLMHRIVLNIEVNPGLNTKFVVDHINQDKLDNRKDNLRLSNRANNFENGIVQNRPSRGISIWRNGKHTYWRYVYRNKTIGYFKTKEEAEQAKHKHICLLNQ